MRVFVVTPTYNERQNISVLTERIFSLGMSDITMVVVDDNSPDGTAEDVRALALKYPIKLISRRAKGGLSSAYVAGFREAIREKPDLVVQMDADLSHNPSDIPRLIAQAANCDLVLGSRYVTGGKIENWDAIRKNISRFGNIYARSVLSLPYKDITGGFKCWRREALENINLNSLSSAGYNFQIETTHAAHNAGDKITEVPITFIERKLGASKFNLPIMLEAFWKVLVLRFRKRK